MADVNISKYRASVVRDGSKPASPGFVVSEGQDPVNPPGTNNFVPYTGATANVELGEFGVEAGFVTLDTTPTNIPTDQGAIYWDDTRSTAALIMNGTLQHIGQDSFFYVKNSSGSTIPKGTCVGFAGTDGGSGHLLITPFLANGSVPSTYFMGVTCESIANGSFGQVMHFGELEGINTSGFTAGALLYASSTVAGAFQTTPPVAPNNIILVAAAVNSKNNGAIVVRPTLGSNFGTNESVKLTSVTDKDLLQYTVTAGVGLWENKTLAQVIGSAYVPSTRTLTINGTALDLSVDRSWSVGDMLLNTYQNVTGTKVFGTNRLIMEGEGTAQPTSLSNTQTSNSALTSHNSFGFNGSNNIYFNKGTTANGGIFAFSNTATRTYTLKDASGTLAFTSDIPSLSGYVQGSGSAGQVAYWNGTNSQTGNNNFFWDTSTNRLRVNSSVANSNLTVSGSDNTDIFTVLSGLNSRLHVGTSTSPNNDVYIRSQNNYNLKLGTNTTNYLTIFNSGNVLIQSGGTTTDNGAMLQVSGAGTFTGTGLLASVRINNTTASTGKDWHLYSLNNGNFGLFNNTDGSYAYQVTPSGNLGLGVTPSAWNSIFKVLQLQDANIFSFSGNPGLQFTTNAYFDTGFKYQRTAGATYYVMAPDSHQWHIAPSGTAGNAISFTQAMTLTSGGNLLVGTTSDAGYRLEVAGVIRANGGQIIVNNVANNWLQSNQNGTSAQFQTWFASNGTTRRGYFGYPSGASDNFTLMNEANGQMAFGTNGSTALTLASTGAATFSNQVTSGSWFNAPNGFGLTARNAANNAFRTLIFLNSSNQIEIGRDTDISQIRLGTASAVDAMTITSSGNVGIGTSSPNANLEVATANSLGSFAKFRLNAPYYNYWEFVNNSALEINRGGSTHLTISNVGNVLIGTTTDSGAKFRVFGTGVSANIYSDNNTYSLGLGYQGVLHGYIGGISSALYALSSNGGQVFLNSSSVWAAVSDVKRKRNFENYDLGLDAILGLKPKYYHMDFQSDKEQKQVGLIAQEVKEFIPQAFEQNNDFIGLNYNTIIVTMVKAIQEQQEIIKDLKQRIQ